LLLFFSEEVRGSQGETEAEKVSQAEREEQN